MPSVNAGQTLGPWSLAKVPHRFVRMSRGNPRQEHNTCRTTIGAAPHGEPDASAGGDFILPLFQRHPADNYGAEVASKRVASFRPFQRYLGEKVPCFDSRVSCGREQVHPSLIGIPCRVANLVLRLFQGRGSGWLRLDPTAHSGRGTTGKSGSQVRSSLLRGIPAAYASAVPFQE